MYERIIEIIVYVISELKQKKQFNEIDIEKLQRKGYSSSEISTAFSWLADRLELSDKYFSESGLTQNNSFRLLHDAEKDLFTTDAWGELVQLNTLGILSNEHIESLIENSTMLGMKQIDRQQLKFFVANNVFNAQINELPGNRYMLTGNDTIN